MIGLLRIPTHTKMRTIILILLLAAAPAFAQSEILTNVNIKEMSAAGIGTEVILAKIRTTPGDYAVTADAMIDLKKAGVADEVVAAMITVFNKSAKQNQSAAAEAAALPPPSVDRNVTAAQLLKEARTIYFVKNSLYPSIADLESSLFKRPKWDRFNLTITRVRSDADLVVEINHEFMTHYAFRVTDRRTGRVITASGVTSLGGALSGNIADKLIKRFSEVLANRTH